jgi:hypothetical protein
MKKTLLPFGLIPPVYQSQAQVDAANRFAQDFAARKNPNGVVSPQDVYVAKRPGDPQVQFIDSRTQMPYQGVNGGRKKAITVPDYLNLEDIQGDHESGYWYETRDGQTIELDPSVFQTTARFRKPQAVQDKDFALRGMIKGLLPINN